MELIRKIYYATAIGFLAITSGAALLITFSILIRFSNSGMD